MRAQTLWLTLLCGAALMGCGPAPEEKAESLLIQGNSTALSVFVAEQLQRDPTNPYFNGLKAIDLLQDCTTRDCGSHNDLSVLHTIQTHLNQVPAEIPVGERGKHFFYRDVGDQVVAYALAHPMSSGLQNVVQLALPAQFPTAPLAAQLADQAYTQLLNDKLAPTIQMLRTIVQLGGNDGHTSGAQMLLNTLTGNVAALTTPPQPKPEILYSTMLPSALLAYVKENKPANFTNYFLDVLTSQPLMVNNTPLALLNSTEEKNAFCQGIADLAQTEGYAKMLAANLLPPNEVASPSAFAQAITLKAALRCAPNNKTLWQQFVPAALSAIKPGSTLGIIYDGFDLNDISADIAQINNDQLFVYIDKLFADGTNISPALKEVIYRPDAHQDAYLKKAEDAITRALETAIQQKNTATLVSYIQDQENLMAGHENQIAQALQAALDGLWDKNDFDTLKTVVHLLESKLKPHDFDLARRANQWLGILLASDAIKQKLIAPTFADLIQPLTKVGLKLGPKMSFLQDVFATQPEVIQNQLQAAAVDNSAGNYGLPLAVMVFYPALAPTSRDTLLTNALVVSLRRDDTLSATHIATLGSQFIDANPSLTPDGIATVMVEKAKTIAEGQAAWAAASPPLRDAIIKINPQFAALMRALEFNASGNKAEAAQQLALVTEEPYVSFAQPYLEDYRAILLPYAGVYIHSALTPESRIIRLNITPGHRLLTAQVTLVSAVGQVLTQEALMTNFGNVYFTDAIANLDPRTMSLTLDTSTTSNTLGNLSFDKVFGTASTLKIKEGSIELTDKEGHTSLFKKVTSTTMPQGTFTVKTTLNPDSESDNLLQVGTRFNLEESHVRVTFPEGLEAVTTARFNPRTMTLDLSYPYTHKGTTLEAVVRCQLLGTSGLCAAHNRHWAGKRYSHRVLMVTP